MRRLATKAQLFLPLTMAVCFGFAAQSQTLDSFGALAGSTITSTGATVISGNVGVSPGSAVTGFPPGVVLPPYAFFRNDAGAAQAQKDLTIAYNILAARPATADVTGQNLGGLTLTPGVYNAANSSQLTGTLTLDGQGNPNAVFVFKIGSTLTTASASQVRLINGAQGGNVFFQVGSSATLGTGTEFIGKILALTSITLNTNASLNCGSALARNGAVTLDSNTISICSLATATYTAQVGPTAAANAIPVAAAIDTYIAGGAVTPLSFLVLPVALNPTELAAALRQLSGEAGTGAAPAGFQAMNAFMSTLFDNAFDDRPEPVPEASPQTPLRSTISVMGYAPVAAPNDGSGAFARLRQAPSPAYRLWSVWGAAYGGRTQTDGDRVTGAHDRTTQNFGIAAGADYRVTPDTKLGFALGGGTTRFGLSGGMGGGTSDMAQAAIYARQDWGQAYATAALAYAWHDVSTSRVVTLGGSDVLAASFQAHNLAGQLEAGYRFGWFIPYAGIGVQGFMTPSYRETNVSPFALSVDGRTAVATRSQLGFRTEQKFSLGDGVALRLRTRAAWAHDFSSVPYVDAGFTSLPGSVFRVRGAALAKDALLLSAGAEVAFANGFSVSGLLDSQLARDSRSYSGRAQLRYSW